MILEASFKNQLTNFIFANLECWAAFRKTVERGVWWWCQYWPSFIFLGGKKVFGMEPRTNHYNGHNSLCSIWKCTHWRWETALLATSNSVHHMWRFLPPVVTILITLISFTLWVRKGGRHQLGGHLDTQTDRTTKRPFKIYAVKYLGLKLLHLLLWYHQFPTLIR